MCGFVGYASTQAPLERVVLERMRDTLAHRGPDGAGLWTHHDAAAAVGLGHRRLAIIDTRDVGLQPMTDDSGRLTIAFNGEIYDFAAARAALEATGRHAFRTRTDTEVILHQWRADGAAALRRLQGMFAFALWDTERRMLTLARDRFGKKPIYYAHLSDGTLIFGSEIKALLASGRVDDEVDLQAHEDYLALNYVPGPRTMFAGVRKVPPAHTLTWRDGRVHLERYWDLELHSAAAHAPVVPSMDEAARGVLERLDAAVARRLVSDVPLGMFLSGGIDSSAVLTSMARASQAPIQAFTIRFDEADYDESSHARLIARTVGATHHVETVRPEPDTFLGPLVDAFDEPFADSSAIPMWYLARLARQHVTVALGGDGGDELFAGYRTHRALRLATLWRRLPQRLREDLVPALVARLPVSHGKVSFDLKAKQFVASASADPARAFFGFKEFLREPRRRALCAAPTAVESPGRLFDAAFSAHEFRDALDAALYADCAIYLPDDILVKVDRMTMAHALEARTPFLDTALAEYAAALPARAKLFGLRTKHILKRALRGRVPLRILERGKAGFNVPMATWLNGALLGHLRDALSPERVRALGLWSPPEVARLLDEHERRTHDHSRPLWAMLCFVAWRARHTAARWSQPAEARR